MKAAAYRNKTLTHPARTKQALSPIQRLASRMKRVTTSGNYIPEIDGLRFVAISSVFLFHVAVNLPPRNLDDYDIRGHSGFLYTILNSGDFGVQAFFIVSGFVLAVPFVRHELRGASRVRLKAYYLRRVTRLEPPYILAMIGSFVLLVVIKAAAVGPLAWHLLAGLIYSHNVIYGFDNPVNNVAWSLEIEIQFYLLAPFLALIFKIRSARRRRLTLALASLLFASLGTAIFGHSPHLHHTILAFAQYFLVGFLLADLFVSGRLRPKQPRRVWDLVAVGAVVVTVAIRTLEHRQIDIIDGGVMDGILLHCTILASCSVAFYAVFRGILVNRLLTLKWVTIIGGMCYSIYLLHNVLMGYGLSATKSLVPTGSFAVNFTFQIAMMACLALAASAAYFLVIERPCMDKNWPRRLYARLRAVRSEV